MSDDTKDAGMHHYPWHPGDYQLATNHWSELRTPVQVETGLLHDLAYRRLIDLYYGNGGPIPDKTQWVATRVRMLAHAEIVGSVLKEKFTRKDGFWVNDKCDKEIAKYRKRVVANQENGKKGGRKPSGQAKANPVGSKPRTKNHKPNTPLPPEGEAAWEVFWTTYPRKEKKPNALKAYAKALQKAAPEAILAGLQRYIACDQWTADATKIPHPATWLNAEQWNDTPAKAPAAGTQADDPNRWWASRSGIERKGMEFGLPAPPPADADLGHREWYRFQASVWRHAGDGPWIDSESRSYPIFKQLLNGAG